MTNKRQLYYRRKEGKIVAEGKHNGKTIFLFTLPDIETVAKSSLFSQEKQQKILEKISRLDYMPEKTKEEPDEVLTSKVVRTSEKDENDQIPEDKKELKELVDNFDFID